MDARGHAPPMGAHEPRLGAPRCRRVGRCARRTVYLVAGIGQRGRRSRQIHLLRRPGHCPDRLHRVRHGAGHRRRSAVPAGVVPAITRTLLVFPPCASSRRSAGPAGTEPRTGRSRALHRPGSAMTRSPGPANAVRTARRAGARQRMPGLLAWPHALPLHSGWPMPGQMVTGSRSWPAGVAGDVASMAGRPFRPPEDR